MNGDDPNDMPVTARILYAARYATEMHAGQVRAGTADIPYVSHVLEVAELAARATGGDETITLAAILHDCVEDTAATEEDIARGFGRAVADIVMAVTDPPGLDRAARKRRQLAHMAELPPEARIVKMADLLSNTRGLLWTRPDWPREALVDYAMANKPIFEAARGTNAFLEAEWDAAWPEVVETFDLPDG